MSKNKNEYVTFSFGSNLQNYIDNYFNDERLKIAINSLKFDLDIKSLKDKTFLDVGCGCGLGSLSAVNLGASEVLSFDFDYSSYQCTKSLSIADQKNWNVLHGSVLDKSFMKNIKKFDVVYTFGSLCHTGNMFEAIKVCSNKVNKGGLFFFSVLNKKLGLRGSHNQIKLKRLYNKSPHYAKKLLEFALIYNFYIRKLISFKNPFRIIREQEKSPLSRGMDFRSGIIDWLGALPYEYATGQEIYDFCTKKLNLELADMHLVDERNALGLNHFLFRKL